MERCVEVELFDFPPDVVLYRKFFCKDANQTLLFVGRNHCYLDSQKNDKFFQLENDWTVGAAMKWYDKNGNYHELPYRRYLIQEIIDLVWAKN